MKYYYAVDIGGTSVKLGMVDELGAITRRDAFPTGSTQTAEAFLDLLMRACREAVQNGAMGIGISSLGFVNTVRGTFEGGTENLPFLTRLNLPQLVGEACRVPVSVMNDASAAAIGEMRFGAARGCRDFICLTVGTGLGGALVLNGQLIEGAHFRAGEFGYWDFEDAAHYLETRYSATTTLKRAAELLGVERISGVDFFARVRANDAICNRVFRDMIDRLSAMLANLILALDVSRIVIGGGFSGAKDVLIPALDRAIALRVPQSYRGQYAIVAAECGNDAGMLGAVDPFFTTDCPLDRTAMA